MMQYGSRQDFVFGKGFFVGRRYDGFDLAAGQKDILQERGSRRINDPEVLENFGAYPWFQAKLGNQIDSSPS